MPRPITCFTLCSVLTVATLAAVTSDPGSGAPPLVACWQLSQDALPQTRVANAAAPRAVIYEDGTSISMVLPSRAEPELYQKALAAPLFVTQTLGGAELGSWYDDVLALAGDDTIASDYTLDPDRSDHGVLLGFFTAGRMIAVLVRGLDETSLDRFGAPRATNARAVPARLLRLYQHLRQLADASAREWQPRRFELRLAPAPANLKPSARWPDAWAEWLRNRRTGEGGEYSVLLDPAQHARVAALLRAGPPPGPLEIDGQLMQAEHRPMFPHEERWRDAWQANVRAFTGAGRALDADPKAQQRERAELREALRRRPTQVTPP